MEATLTKEKISSIYNEVSEASFYERKNVLSEEQIINTFLDAILVFQKDINEKNEKLTLILSKMQELTWITDEVTEDDLKLISILISMVNDFHSMLIRQYVLFNNIFTPKKIAVKEIKTFKRHIDDIKESCEDIEMIFFNLRQDDELKQMTNELLSL